MFSLRFHTSVEFDIREIRSWYNKKQTGLGNDFEDAATTCFKKVLQRPFISSEKHNAIRLRMVSKRFSSYYVHSKRDPKLWSKRIPS